MATHSSTLAWKIPWTEEPGGLWRATVQGIAKNWTQLSVHTHTHTHTHKRKRIFKRNGKEGDQSEGLGFCFVLFFNFR